MKTLNSFGKKINILLFVILTIGLICPKPVSAAISNPPVVSAQSSILVDSLWGQVLLENNSTSKTYASSASNIMTMLLAIEKLPIDTIVTVSKESLDVEDPKINLGIGEKYSVEDLLYALCLTSANDAANSLAEETAGSVDKFVVMMNEKAKALGMADTNFTDPFGYYNENQYTTARDLAILVRYSISNRIFDNIFSTSAKPWSDKASTQILVNQNKLFWWGYSGVDGGMVGTGENLLLNAITTVGQDNQRLISIVLNSYEDAVFHDTTAIMNYGFSNFKTGLLVRSGEVLTNAAVGEKQLPLASIENIYYSFPIGESNIKNLEFKINENIKFPVTKDMVIGSARYTLNDDTVINISLYSTEEALPESRFVNVIKTQLLENKDILFILILLVSLELILIIHHLVRYFNKRIDTKSK